MTDSTSIHDSAYSGPLIASSSPAAPSSLSANDSALSLADNEPHHDDSNSNSNSQAQDEDDEEAGFDDDSAYDGGSLIGCDTDTLASYITDYTYENGRRYHAYRDGEYWVCALL